MKTNHTSFIYDEAFYTLSELVAYGSLLHSSSLQNHQTSNIQGSRILAALSIRHCT